MDDIKLLIRVCCVCLWLTGVLCVVRVRIAYRNSRYLLLQNGLWWLIILSRKDFSRWSRRCPLRPFRGPSANVKWLAIDGDANVLRMLRHTGPVTPLLRYIHMCGLECIKFGSMEYIVCCIRSRATIPKCWLTFRIHIVGVNAYVSSRWITSKCGFRQRTLSYIHQSSGVCLINAIWHWIQNAKRASYSKRQIENCRVC